ncbi:MAG: hypothetical protein E5W70_19835 [Mesorhizobium sp.]|uniref:hypothetical protein n=1 Tax=Mesorhizobium sp. TaxID=1871066 RepID=UPI0011F87FF2|nr:hypothetical protein [Mesorhizobium sp.]TIT20748.1 MAG: hypothetical protein E5W70_19835 [Mesorhizobium sp.]
MSGKVNGQPTTENDPIRTIAIGSAKVSFGEKTTWDRDGKTDISDAAEAPSWLVIIMSVRLVPGVGREARLPA